MANVFGAIAFASEAALAFEKKSGGGGGECTGCPGKQYTKKRALWTGKEVGIFDFLPLAGVNWSL